MEVHDRTMVGCLGAAALALLVQMVMLSLPSDTAALPDHTSMLTVHLLLELFAFSIAMLIVTVSWHTFEAQPGRSANVLICGFLIVAACDLLHALTYEGMPPFLGPSGTERGIFFWLMGRTFEVAALGLLALGVAPRVSRNGALLAGLIVSGLLVAFGTLYIDRFPPTFVEGVGVTPFKAGYEIVLLVLNVAVAAALWQRGRQRGESRYFLLATSAWLIGIGELSFTSYVDPSDFQNMFGHAFKIAAYGLLYSATFRSSLRAPFDALQNSELRAIESERRVRSLSDNLPNCVVYQVVQEHDGTMRFLHVSQAVERLNGVSVAEVMEDPGALYRQIHPEDRPAVDQAERRSAEERTVFEQVVRMRRRDGVPRWMKIVSAPRRLADGRICWDGVQTDITEAREAELQRQENEAMLAAVIDSASDAVIGTDTHGRITLFNPAAERIFGYTAKAVQGLSVGRLLPPGARARHGEHLLAFAASGTTGRRMSAGRVQGLRADGTELELEASISQVRVNNRLVLTAILRDVTDRVRADRALARYQLELAGLTHKLMAQEKETTRRLAQVLHDQLGQTLTAIRIDFDGGTPPADPVQAERHQRVDRMIDQAIREVRQVLVDLRPSLLDELGLFAALDNELRARHRPDRPVSLRLEVADALQAQRWSPDVEYAVFMVAREAIANALEHAGASLIRVVLTGGPEALQLEVIDNGTGIESERETVRPGHLGMVGMRERSLAIGARFQVRSSPGGGSTISLAWSGVSP